MGVGGAGKAGGGIGGSRPPISSTKLHSSSFSSSFSFGEGFSILCATSIPAGIGLIAVLIWTRSILWAWTILGALLLDWLCLSLKALIMEPRPVLHPLWVLESEGPYGMPSEHAAFALFLLLQGSLRLWSESQSISLRVHEDLLPTTRVCLTLLLSAWAAGTVASRYQTGAHSAQQLAVGACIGGAAGLGWFILERRLERPLIKAQGFLNASVQCVSMLYGFDKDHDD